MKKEVFFDRTNEHYFFDEPEAIANYCRENYKEDVRHIIRVANEVCEHYFLFDLKWDMERTYEPVIFKEKIDWKYMPSNDPEFVWQFNRHRFFICLGQAYQLTKDEKYAKTFVELLSNWVKDVPLVEENMAGPWRSLETGMRGEIWNKALHYFKESSYITEAFLDLFYKSMIEHAEHLIACHSSYRYMSNWGVIENHGLFDIAMMLPQSEQTKKYRDFALKNLEIEARMQIMGDGTQWEQSPMYHNEVLHCYLDVLTLAERNQVELSSTIKERIRRMAYVDMAWKKPNHHQVTMGDSDDTDIRDYISHAAYIFRDPVLKYVGFEKLDFETIWELGMEAEKIYEAMESKMPNFTSCALNDSGNYYIRSGWDEKANFLHFHCGTLGAGHGHSDKLHIDLVIYGEDILMDAGRYSYVSGPSRFEFKNPTAHNTLTVDGKFFTICKDSWECSKLSQPVKQSFVEKEDYIFIQGGHLGYMDMGKGVFVNRKIVHIKPDIYVLIDECYTGDEHCYNQYFHFNNHGKVEMLGNKVSYKGEEAQADFYFVTEGIGLENIPTRLSRNYNQAEANESICTSLKGKGFTSMITVIKGAKLGEENKIKIEKLPVRSALKKIDYPSHMAEALKLKVSDREYILVVCHQEVNTPTDLVEVEGCMGYGNVIVFNLGQDCLVGTVLNW